ncbi:MAG: hypothetical protein BRC29_04975 [Nanohaloarchaea archaeon SW_7_43_1]|nr:MAG: hypothetical protein BRC29_04975 [Nanohaloarchaea archaeon SW_7_43_1]
MKSKSVSSKDSCRKITDEYLVGLIDGEGTINLTKYPDGRERPQVLIFNTCKKILDEIKRQRSLTAPVMKVSRVGDNLDRKKNCYRIQMRSRSDIRKMFELMKEHKPIIKKQEFEELFESTKNWVYHQDKQQDSID